MRDGLLAKKFRLQPIFYASNRNRNTKSEAHMLGPILIYPAWLCLCVAGIFRPWIALVGFYGCVLLEPTWNWRWSIPQDFAFQKYLAASAILGFVLTGFPGNKLCKPLPRAMLSLSVFLAIAYVSAMRSIDPVASKFWMSNMWKIVVMALLAVRLLDTPKKIWTFLLVLSFAQGYSAYQINLQYFQTGISAFAHRPWGLKGDNNLYSNLTVPLIAISASIAIYSRVTWQKWAAGVVGLLQMHQLMLMDSRGAMLATTTMGVFFVWLMPKSKQTLRGLLVATIVGVILAGPPVVNEFSSIFASEGERDASAESRWKLWQAGWEITKDYPLLGVGPYAGQRLVPSYYEGRLNTRQKGLHNLAFQITTNVGIPAALFYFAFFFIPWWHAWKSYLQIRRNKFASSPTWYQAVCLSLAVGIPGYIAASMFSSAALLEPPYAMAALGLASIAVMKQHERLTAPPNVASNAEDAASIVSEANAPEPLT